MTYQFPSASVSTWGPQECLGSPPRALSICLSIPVPCLHFASVQPQMSKQGEENCYSMSTSEDKNTIVIDENFHCEC